MIEREKFYISFSHTMSFITIVLSIYFLLNNNDRTTFRSMLLIFWTGIFVFDIFKAIKGHFAKDKKSQETTVNIVQNMSNTNYFISIIVVGLIKIFVPFLING